MDSGGDWTSLNAPMIEHMERKFTDDGKLGRWIKADGGELKYQYDAAGRSLQLVIMTPHPINFDQFF